MKGKEQTMERLIQSRTEIRVINREKPTIIKIQFRKDEKGDTSCSFTDRDKSAALRKALSHALLCTGLEGTKFKYTVGVVQRDEMSFQVLVRFAGAYHEWTIRGYPKDSIMLGLKSLNNGIQRAH